MNVKVKMIAQEISRIMDDMRVSGEKPDSRELVLNLIASIRDAETYGDIEASIMFYLADMIRLEEDFGIDYNEAAIGTTL